MSSAVEPLTPLREARAPSGYSILIPTYNRAELLLRAVESVDRLVRPEGVDVELVVVDNNCTDHTAKVIESGNWSLPVRRVVEPTQGLNHARNRAVVAARHDFLVFLDDDMEVHPAWLQACHAALRELPADAVCGPVQPRFEVPPARWLTPALLDSVTSAYSRKGEQRLLLGTDHGHELPGCNFGVWRSHALALNGFHPSLDRSERGMLAGGDTEFGLRLVAAGCTTAYLPDCAIDHWISRQKTSFRGLVRRWYGLGKTEYAVRSVRGDRPGRLARTSRHRGMLRTAWQCLTRSLRGQRGPAAEALLSLVRQRGFLAMARRVNSVRTETSPVRLVERYR